MFMGPYVSRLILIGLNASLWVLMGPYESLCVLIGFFSSASVFMGLYKCFAATKNLNKSFKTFNFC